MGNKQKYWGKTIATVLVFWSAVEVFVRNGMFTEIRIEPLHYVPQMVSVLVVFILVGLGIIYKSKGKKATRLW